MRRTVIAIVILAVVFTVLVAPAALAGGPPTEFPGPGAGLPPNTQDEPIWHYRIMPHPIFETEAFLHVPFFVTNTVTLTLTDLVKNSRVVIYSTETMTELDRVENAGISFSYTYTYAANTYVDIIISRVNYITYRIQSYLLPDFDNSISIKQVPTDPK